MDNTDNQELSKLTEAAQEAYERAAADGLCKIGALEIALNALRQQSTAAPSKNAEL
jgi:hypothetical protein